MPPSCRWTRPRRTSPGACRSAPASPPCSRSSGSPRAKGLVREQFGEDLQALTEAEQDSKELKSAKRHLLFERIIETVELPFPVGPATVDGESPVVKDSLTKSYVKKAAEAIYKDLVRKKIAIEKRRPDGRGTDEIRAIECEVTVSPRAHGSALFQRGQTQILTLCTLGTAKEGQRIDDLSLETDRRYMHHYNFPPYSVGETGFMRGPKRRDIGHGALAQRALEAMIPSAEDFPYTIRLVSETLESNGSSSMGSVCGSTLALMDAGVPIKAPVSGIAMGLVKEGDDYVILTDIQGAEDHLGDMDFKVAGTKDGITALQMDIKITGVTQEIMRGALDQAKQARIFILDRMLEALPEARTELAPHAPRISSIQINPDFIGMVIGKGGETIRSLESEYDVQIDIEEDGTILVYATEGTKADAAIAAIAALTKEPEVGDTFTGKVVKTTQFGAFVELKKGTDGLLHVSNVGPGRVAHIEDVMSRGDVVDVLVQEVDKARGRIGLKLVHKHEDGRLVEPEELIERAKSAPPRPPEEERPRRDGDRGGRQPRPAPRLGNTERGGASRPSLLHRNKEAELEKASGDRDHLAPLGRRHRREHRSQRPAVEVADEVEHAVVNARLERQPACQPEPRVRELPPCGAAADHLLDVDVRREHERRCGEFLCGHVRADKEALEVRPRFTEPIWQPPRARPRAAAARPQHEHTVGHSFDALSREVVEPPIDCRRRSSSPVQPTTLVSASTGSSHSTQPSQPARSIHSHGRTDESSSASTIQLAVIDPKPSGSRTDGSESARSSLTRSRPRPLSRKTSSRSGEIAKGGFDTDEAEAFAGHRLEEAAQPKLDVFDAVQGAIELGECQRALAHIGGDHRGCVPRCEHSLDAVAGANVQCLLDRPPDCERRERGGRAGDLGDIGWTDAAMGVVGGDQNVVVRDDGDLPAQRAAFLPRQPG